MRQFRISAKGILYAAPAAGATALVCLGVNAAPEPAGRPAAAP